MSRPDDHDDKRVQLIDKQRRRVPCVAVHVRVLAAQTRAPRSRHRAVVLCVRHGALWRDGRSISSVARMTACRTGTRAGESGCVLVNSLIVELSEECRKRRLALDISVAMLAWLEYGRTN